MSKFQPKKRFLSYKGRRSVPAYRKPRDSPEQRALTSKTNQYSQVMTKEFSRFAIFDLPEGQEHFVLPARLSNLLSDTDIVFIKNFGLGAIQWIKIEMVGLFQTNGTPLYNGVVCACHSDLDVTALTSVAGLVQACGASAIPICSKANQDNFLNYKTIYSPTDATDKGYYPISAVLVPGGVADKLFGNWVLARSFNWDPNNQVCLKITVKMSMKMQ